MGLVNYGAHYDEVRKGIHDSVALAGKDITHGPWYHQIGLLGEEENVSSFDFRDYFAFDSHDIELISIVIRKSITIRI
jgi:hypothetical protein